MNKDIQQDTKDCGTQNSYGGTETDDAIDHAHGSQRTESQQRSGGANQQDQNHKGSYHERMTRRIAIAAGAIALLSLVSSGFSAWSAWDSSDAAMHSGKIAKNSLIIGQRPFVGASGSPNYNLSQNPKIGIILNNYGKTPAIVKEECVNILGEDDNSRNKIYPCNIFINSHRSEIFPGQNYEISFNSEKESRFNKIKYSNDYFVLYGIVKYTDQLKIDYTKEFCFVYKDDMGTLTRLRDCGNMNDSTSSFNPTQ